MADDPPTDSAVETLRAAGEAGRAERLGRLFEEHRRRLLRMVELRMDPVLRQRIGASDVLQEAYVEIAGRVDDYLADPRMPFFLWIRFITAQRLLKLHRFHVGAKKRDVRRQVAHERPARPGVTAVAVIDHLAASGVSPSGVAMAQEWRRRLLDALEGMGELDREVLVLRHFEELSNGEAAAELGIGKDAASKRYVRALRRLREVLATGSESP